MNNPHVKKTTMINIQSCILDGMRLCMTPVQNPYYQQPSSTYGQLNQVYRNPSFFQPMPSYINQANRSMSQQIGQAAEPSSSTFSRPPENFVNPIHHMMGEPSPGFSRSSVHSQCSSVSVNDDDETRNLYAM